MAAWLCTPRGVEKGSCLNGLANGVIVKSVEIDYVDVTDYEKIHLHLLLNVDDTERRDVFCPPHCFRSQKSRHLCAEKRRKKQERNVSILDLPVS